MPDVKELTKLFKGLTLDGILSSLVLLLVCLVLIRIITGLFRRILSRTQLDDRLQRLILTGIKTLLYVVSAIIVAQTLGIPSTSLVALLSVATLAISLAIQGMLSNVASGMMLLTSRPISLGDLVEVCGVTGVVDEISLIYTKLHAPDGQMIMLPNSSISNEKIVNYTTLGQRRITITVGASYDAAVPDVRKALLEAAEKTPDLLAEPAPVVYVNAYQDSCIEYVLYAWSSAADYWVTHYVLNEAVKTAFDKYDIEMTYPHLNVHVMDGSQLKVKNSD